MRRNKAINHEDRATKDAGTPEPKSPGSRSQGGDPSKPYAATCSLAQTHRRGNLGLAGAGDRPTNPRTPSCQSHLIPPTTSRFRVALFVETVPGPPLTPLRHSTVSLRHLLARGQDARAGDDAGTVKLERRFAPSTGHVTAPHTPCECGFFLRTARPSPRAIKKFG